ncbi:MAG TPA: hypothetical protein VK188_12135, partial [Holophaga sp.]|nr:hypothetical protein [Holophaga sp.]
MALLDGKARLSPWLSAAVLAHLLLLPCWRWDVLARSPSTLLTSREAALGVVPALLLVTLGTTLLCRPAFDPGPLPRTRSKYWLILGCAALVALANAVDPPLVFRHLGWVLAAWFVVLGGLFVLSARRPGLHGAWPLIPVLWGTLFFTLPPGSDARIRRPKVPPGGQPVWVILFDELDGDLLESAMASDPAVFPALTSMRQQAVRFTQASTTARETLSGIATLVAGRSFQGAREIEGPALELTTKENQKIRLDSRDTVFADIRSRGGAVATVGWYWPYPRLLGQVMDGWAWTPSSLFSRERVAESSLGGRIQDLGETLLGQRPDERLPVSSLSPEDRVATQAADRLRFQAGLERYLSQGPAGFTWIHAPFPHSPGVRVGGTYRESLLLCDRFLADLRSRLEADGRWESACVVLVSDHPLRPEIDHGSGFVPPGKTWDLKTPGRIPLWIKLPGQSTPLEVTAPLSAEALRPLLLAMAQGSIRTPEQVANWAGAGRSVAP